MSRDRPSTLVMGQTMVRQSVAVDIEERPWGAWKVVHKEAAATVKVLTVNPGCMLSLQRHSLRSECWVPLESGLVAYTRWYDGCHESASLLEANRAFTVGTGRVHRLANPTDKVISLVEIINGTYDEDDIERLHDAYGR